MSPWGVVFFYCEHRELLDMEERGDAQMSPWGVVFFYCEHRELLDMDKERALKLGCAFFHTGDGGTSWRSSLQRH
jgi:hypothetical protein